MGCDMQPGEAKVYRSTDTGDTAQLSTCEAATHLHLKVNAPVVLIVNLSDTLVNGSRGAVKEMNDNFVRVSFETINTTVDIKKFRFSVYDQKKKRNVAHRTQIPLKLAYSFTVHKAQGLTLENLEIDARRMNFPGQLGGAVGRAVSIDGLRVINVDKCFIQKQQRCIEDYITSDSSPLEDGGQCCMKPVDNERPEEDECETGNGDTSDEDFDQQGDEDVMNLITDQIEEAESTADVPADIDMYGILERSRFSNPANNIQQKLNTAVDYLLENMADVEAFVRRIWNFLKNEWERLMPEPLPVVKRKITNFYENVVHFLSTEKYKVMVATMFSRIDIQSHHYRTAFTIVQELRKRIVFDATEDVVKHESEEALKEKRKFKSSGAGFAKMRYIAGWCIGTLRHSKQKYVKKNLYSQNVRATVDKTAKEIICLEELMATEEEIFQKSENVTCLMEIQRKQNVRKGLCNVTDPCFAFFTKLDEQIRGLETLKNVHIHGSRLYDFIENQVQQSIDLSSQLGNLFHEDEIGEDIKDSLLQKVASKYIQMSSNQLRRECNRLFGVEKEMAHRKKVLQKRQAKIAQKWTLRDIREDKSEERRSSHRYLQSQLEAETNFFLKGPFTKNDLTLIGSAYGLKVEKKWNKSQISDKLYEIILSNDAMVQPSLFDSVCSPTIQKELTSSDPATNMEPCSPSGSGTQPTSDVFPTTVTDVDTGPSSSGVGHPSSPIPEHDLPVEETVTSVSTATKKRGRKGTCKGKKGSTYAKGKKKAISQRRVVWPCGICETECSDCAVCCDMCDTWHHFTCLNKTCDEDEFQSDEPWLCPTCAETDTS